jgi:hypothetical protein
MGREWGGIEEGEVSLRVTWGEGGWDSITPKEGFQVSKREWKGNREQGTSKGSRKRGIAHNLILSIHVHVYNNRVNETNNLMCLGYK